MSCLKLYAPDINRVDDACENRTENPPTVSMNNCYAKALSKTVLERSRRIYDNRICLNCRSAAVVPLELADGVRLTRQHSLAGTGTLIGFRCSNCLREWQA